MNLKSYHSEDSEMKSIVSHSIGIGFEELIFSNLFGKGSIVIYETKLTGQIQLQIDIQSNSLKL